MIVTLCTERIRTLDDIRAFLGGNEAADITPHDREAAYAFIERALVRFRYHLGLSRAGKGLVREFLAKVTGYSDSQLSRLIAQQRRTGRIRDHRLRPPARPFATVYTTADAVLLAEVDEAFGQLSGPATKRILWRQYHVFGDERFERLAGISNGHIYNLRGRRAYRSARTTFRATRGAISSIGKRRRPRPEGRPGFVRVDTVHSGDLGGEKGAYVINMVDEVTQFQQLAAVPRITEHFMVPVLAALVGAFPFRVLGFHADNGSEYIDGEEAGPVMVEEGGEEVAQEGVGRWGQMLRDVAVPQPPADDVAVLGLHQRVVVRAPGPGLRELLDVQLVQHRRDPVVAATLRARSANPKIDASINPHLRTPPRPLPSARSCSCPGWK